MIYLIEKQKYILIDSFWEKIWPKSSNQPYNFPVYIFNTNCSRRSITFKIHWYLPRFSWYSDFWLFFKNIALILLIAKKSKIHFHRFIFVWILQRQLCLNMKLLHSANPAEYSVHIWSIHLPRNHDCHEKSFLPT